MKILIMLSIAFAALSAAAQNNCHGQDAVCVGENLILHLKKKSGNVKSNRLINRMYNQCQYSDSACTERFIRRAINQAFGHGNGGGGNNGGHINGSYSYTVSPYGGCAGAGMDVQVDRRYGQYGTEYRVKYRFQADYKWQNHYQHSSWFTTTQRFGWRNGRDNPWFRIEVRRNNAHFVRGDCKGGTNKGTGYDSWPIRFR